MKSENASSDSDRVLDPFDRRYQSTCFVLCDEGVNLGDGFAVITAANPNGRLLSPTQNDERNGRLKQTVLDAGLVPIPIIGSSPDFTHQEYSFVIQCTFPWAADAASQFQQLAFYWVIDGLLYLVDTHSTEHRSLGEWRNRLVSPGET